ncbi:MAG TPA: glycine cleavage system protein GcvH [Polyangiaceae bacterium]|nr:glycine cleavage system protein GcvH [Polyangiaceae bacterium]
MSSATETKDDRKYTKEHEWALAEKDEILVGITAFAVDQLGDVTLVGLDVKPGDAVELGKPFGTIESVKTLSDLFAPVSGVITRLNTELESKPELINDDPWGKGWMIAIRPSKLADESSGLMDAAAYQKHLVASAH